MKLMEFFSQAQSLGADQNDPLLSIVKTMHSEQARLKSLRSETQAYLIPQKNKPVFDPDCQAEVEALAADIEKCKTNIIRHQEKINKIDAIMAKYQIERPLLKEIRSNIGHGKRSIEMGERKVSGILGDLLISKVKNEEEAKNHPKYLKAVKEYAERKSDIETQLTRFGKALSELEAVMRDAGAGPETTN